VKKVIIEGQLKFTFAENCHASKYDEWSFYRNQFQNICGGSKAVDILCLSQHTLWLIEIKDFRVHRRTKSEDIGDEIAIKVRDTLAGLVAAKVNANDQDEKQFATLALQHLKGIRAVLHLEQPAKHSKLFPKAINPANVKLKLKQRLKAIDAHPLVVDKKSLATKRYWIVDENIELE
jgi:hypothetical protein